MRALGLLFAVCLLITSFLAPHGSSLAQSLIYRSPWEINLGLGLQEWGSESPYHGWEGEYEYATIPSPSDAGWAPAPDPDTIAYAQIPSTLCGVYECRTAGEFTYFRTFVSIPSNVEVTEFTITTSGVDDGIRVSIFNSAHPGGLVVPDSYVFLDGTGTANLGAYVVSGEVNTVIITHVDDCCYHSYLNQVDIVLNGTIVPVPMEIGIAIKPCDSPNSLNLGSRGVVPVAVLTTDSFDASTVDPATALFASASPLRWTMEDVDLDGDVDLLFHFKTQELDLDENSTAATLVGETFDGQAIQGTDAVRIVP
jgi:hypothetical protein